MSVVLRAILCALALTLSVADATPTHSAGPTMTVSHYLPSTTGEDLVVLSGAHGLVNGSTVNIMRQASLSSIEQDRMWVQTGLAKVIQVHNDAAVAKVTHQGTEMSATMFQKFRGVMAGDAASVQNFSITANLAILPEQKLTYHRLFLDPKARPQTLEFSHQGKQELLSAIQPFLKSRIGKIVVEGHTDHVGPSLMNQVESYQRALTVRQFLINQAGIDPEKIVAIGFGEAESTDMSLAPGSRERQRRIVIRTLNHSKTRVL